VANWIRRDSRGRTAFGVGMLVGTLLLGVMLVGLAYADAPPTSVGGVTYRHDTTEVTPPGRFTIDVMCPAGTHVSGGDSFSESGVQGTMQASFPADGADADNLPDDLWRARHSFSASEGTQGLNADVICLGSGLTYSSRQVVLHPGDAQTATAPCGASRHVTGGGAALSAAGSAGYINSSYPWDNGDTGTVPDDGWGARAFNGTGGDVRLTVYAACTDTSPAYFLASGPIAPGAATFVNSACPNTRHLVGEGARMSGSAKFAALVGMADEDGSDSDFAPDDSMEAGARVASASPGSQTITAWAICRL
jgi:hypothetical protein